METETIKNFLRDETGATAVGYVLLVALSPGSSAWLTNLGSNLSDKFSSVATAIGRAS